MKHIFCCTALLLSLFTTPNAHASEAKDKRTPSLKEISAEQLSLRYNSMDGSIWESCKIQKANQPHDFSAKCGPYNFTVHVLFRIWEPAKGSPQTATAYDLFIIVDRHEANGQLTSALQSTWLEVRSGGQPSLIRADVSFDNTANTLQTTINL